MFYGARNAGTFFQVQPSASAQSHLHARSVPRRLAFSGRGEDQRKPRVWFTVSITVGEIVRRKSSEDDSIAQAPLLYFTRARARARAIE